MSTIEDPGSARVMKLTTSEFVKDALERALNEQEIENDLRFTHRMALRKLRRADASAGDRERERRLWAIVQLLNGRIGMSRLDVVDVDEEIDSLSRRLNTAAMEVPE